MIELVQTLQGIIERGLIFGIVAIAVYLSSRLIKFDNLSIEGSFGFGGALTAILLRWNMHPWLSLIVASGLSGLFGVATGLLNTKLKLNHLISGIVVTTALFSLTLKIAGSNMALCARKTIFMPLPFIPTPYQSLIILAVIGTGAFALISWLLKTEIGFLLHTVGDTPQMITNIGKRIDNYLLFGLILSNTLAGLAGALFVQYAGYFSIWTSVGVLLIGLIGTMLAEMINPHFSSALLTGSIIYQALIALTFELQLDQDWNKFITSVFIVLLILIRQWLSRSRK